MDEHTDRWMNIQTDEQTYRQMDEHTDRQMNIQTDR